MSSGAGSSKTREVSSKELEDAMDAEAEPVDEGGGKRLRAAGGEAVKKPEFATISAQEASGGKSRGDSGEERPGRQEMAA